MSIKKSQPILKCFIDLKNSVWFYDGLRRRKREYRDCRSFNVFNTLTAGSQAEKSFISVTKHGFAF